MANFYATYPPSVSAQIPTYANLAAFPSAITAGNGALAIALDTDIVYISDGTNWDPIGGPGVALSVGTFDSGTPSANGAHIDSNALIMQSASATNPGEVNIGAQTFAGVKTFNSAPKLASLTQSLPLQLDASKNVISAAIDLSTSQATGILAAARFPALTGDVTTTAGSLATSLVATSNSTLTSLPNLTTVGALTVGTWNATTIAVLHGGTGVTSLGNLTESTSSVLTITGGTGSVINATTIQVKLAGAAQSGYLSSTDWNTFNNKQASGNYITALTGDVTASGPGSAAASLVATSNATLTTLSALTTASSLATVGTITSGTWSATTIAVNKGGTGLISGTSGGILGFTATTTIASSGLLAANQVMIGGGAGATPSTLAAGTQNFVLIMGASNPAYGQIVDASVSSSAAIAGTKISPDFGSQNITTSGNISTTGTGTLSIGGTTTLSLQTTVKSLILVGNAGTTTGASGFYLGNKVNNVTMIDGTSNGSMTLYANIYYNGTNNIYPTLNASGGAYSITGITALNQPVHLWFAGSDVTHSAGAVAGINTLGSIDGNGLWTLGISGGTQTHVVNGQINLVGGQLQFPATQNASSNANTLDDYEESTWTASITSSGGGSAASIIAQQCTYVKIGKMVYARGYINFNTTGMTAGNLLLSSLPFTMENVASQFATGYVPYWTGWTTTLFMIGLVGNVNTATANFKKTSAGTTTGVQNMQVADASTNCDVMFTIIYNATS